MLAAAFAAALAADVSLLNELEGRVLDVMFLRGRPNPPLPSDAVVHLDIDDTALETVGRWPWPRAVLADAIRAVDELGARVIALDMLLIDPQDAQYLPEGDTPVLDDEGRGQTIVRRIDHDGILATTLRECGARTVLAAHVDDTGTRLSGLWTTDEGREKWQRILDLLRGDITLEAETLIDQVGLGGARAARVRGRIGGIKQIVVRGAAQELLARGEECNEEALRAMLLPAETNARMKDFPSLHIIREVVTLMQALEATESRLPTSKADHGYVQVANVLPPRAPFARAVSDVGIVDSAQDADGTLRRVALRWVKDGRVYPQFGLAAVAAYLGEPPEALAQPELRVGKLRFRGEEMLLSWPRIDPDRPILGLAPHVSLGRVIDLLRSERAYEELVADHDRHSRYLVEKFLPDYDPAELDHPQRRPAVLEELADQVEFLLGDLPADEMVLTEQERESVNAARIWQNQHREIGGAGSTVAQPVRELHAALNGKLVFVGWYATGNFGDFYPTAAHERTPGVVAHAIVANAALTGYAVQPAPRWAGALVTLVLGLLVALLTSRSEPRLSFLVTLLVAALFVTVNLLVVFGQWDTTLAMATPLMGLFAAWAGTVAMNAVRALREKAQLRRQFGARISKRLFDYLIEHPDTVHLDGEEKEVTCFFSDLAGFTAISESLDSRRTVALLNKYMFAMNDELTQLQAYVNKFLGDGIMAVWGTFTVDSAHADRACRAALACLRRLDTLNDSPDFAGLPKLSMRIGIASGVVTVGDCGAPPDLRDYTVIGDAANLASGLESANKQFETRILVNGRCRALLTDDLLLRPLGRITVVGQTTPTEVFEVLATRADATPEQIELAEKTAVAVKLFQDRKLEEAKSALADLTDRFGPSKLARLYLAEIEVHQRHADQPFEGVLQLTSK